MDHAQEAFGELIVAVEMVRLILRWPDMRSMELRCSPAFKHKPCDGKYWNSLTAIANAIIGGKWNGQRFFSMSEHRR